MSKGRQGTLKNFPDGSGQSEVQRFAYEPPQLIDFTDGRQARGATCTTHGSAGGCCESGAAASKHCNTVGSCVSNSPACTTGGGTCDACCGNGTTPSPSYYGCCQATGTCATSDNGNGCNCGNCAFSCYGGSSPWWSLSCTGGACP